MKKKWLEIIGDPHVFLAQAAEMGANFSRRAGGNCNLYTIRAFVKSMNYSIDSDPVILKEIIGAFICAIKDYYAAHVKINGLFKRRIVVTGPGYCEDLFDLFYACIFEGFELAPDGEGLAR